MNLTSPSQVKAWCIENGFHPNKVLGQNFLIDRNALMAIVDAGLDGSAGDVLEIGPGLGVLTEEMLSRGCRVTAIEKDPILAERLKASLGNPANLTVIAADALDWIASPAIERSSNPPMQSQIEKSKNRLIEQFSNMVSNLPYQAGTRILLDLVKGRQLKSMTVLVQTEVAERLVAKEGSKARGLAGVWSQLDYDVSIVRKVSANCFWPRPEIGSSVVRLVRHDRNAGFGDEERKVFHRLTKRAFEHRRKQLGSIFRGVIDSTARAEELSNDDWTALSKTLVGTNF